MINLQEVKRFKQGAAKTGSDILMRLEEEYQNNNKSDELELYFEIVSSQSYGPRMEKFYIAKNNFLKVPSNIDRGDCKTLGEEYIEYKFSYAKESNKYKYNFVQIRPWQNLIGYALEVYAEGNGWHRFNISKSEMGTLLEKYGGLAHGCKGTNMNSKKEMSLRGQIGDSLWCDLQDCNQSDLF